MNARGALPISATGRDHLKQRLENALSQRQKNGEFPINHIKIFVSFRTKGKKF